MIQQARFEHGAKLYILVFQTFLACRKTEKHQELARLALQRHVTTISKSFKVSLSPSAKRSISEKDSGLDIQDKERQVDEIRGLKLENTKLQAEIIALKKQNEEKQEQEDQSAEKLEALKQKSKMFEDHSSLLAFHNNELTEKIHILEDELEFRNEQLESAEKTNAELTKKLKDEHETKTIRNTRKVEGFEKQVKAVKKQVRGQKSTVKERDEELEASKHRISEIRSPMFALRARDVPRKKGIDQPTVRDGQLSGLEMRYENSVREIKLANIIEVEKLGQEIEYLREEISKHRAVQADLKNELYETGLQMQAKQITSDAIISALRINHEEEVEKREKEIQTKLEAEQEKSREEEDRQRRNELADTRKEVQKLRRVGKKNENEKRWLKYSIDVLHSENAQVHFKVHDEKERRKNNRHSYRMKMKGMEMKCLRYEDSNMQLTNEKVDLEMQLQNRECQIKKLEDEMNILNETLDQKDLEVAEITRKMAERKRGLLRIFSCS